ncbi:hypothetical protein PANO111632_21005 [Paracoccus nototheniae]
MSRKLLTNITLYIVCPALALLLADVLRVALGLGQ